ncbi:hypothetical protein SAMN05443661_10572 [Natronobacterium gregoryi]|uniref:Uncharacterized protein n=2 Tax=Natronobacterium gregoryi TaxID=44930 RepID=L0AGF0_NATGS|nr:hypothetical protein Natgr_1271 [Natronobacterium gregoryi SP2]ELY74366.1 hypothetical protein C490_00315 [Natronobacterium gregoryi SP2]PLK21464.1 hypothetical protein CYV19_03980 [Natronobacterium gregoryi SP2]SFI77201.1 hypothetical protein SAMN05443661_10572 [Natronobacterium gregoryi]
MGKWMTRTDFGNGLHCKLAVTGADEEDAVRLVDAGITVVERRESIRERENRYTDDFSRYSNLSMGNYC